jgi:hypothetical protein
MTTQAATTSTPTTTPTTSTGTAAASSAETLATNLENIVASLSTALSMITEPTALTAVEGFFTALPTLLTFMVEFNKFITLVSGGNPQAYVANLGTVMAEWNAATTETEKQNAAQNLANSIRGLPLK